jgi:hypothetical protein
MMSGNKFIDSRHDVCQVQKENYHCFELEKPGCYTYAEIGRIRTKLKLP